LVADDKGLLAMDESTPTYNRRFAALGIPQIEEARRAYRELIVTTPGLGQCVSGAILYDETIRQRRQDSTPFVRALTDAGIIPGIKVDMSNYRASSIMFDCPSGENLTFGTLANRSKPAETQASSRYHPLRSHH
jgi:fructose-bisphosphate aldolase class 1